MWFDGRVRTRDRIGAGGALFVLWALVKWVALQTYVWAPNEYSDTYYYFLQCQVAARDGLAAMVPEYPTPAAALLYLPYLLGAQDYDSYRWGFLCLVVATDALFVLLLVTRASAGAVVAWIFLESLSGRLALLRFDVVPAVLAAAGVLLLTQRRPAHAAPLLALGVAVKARPALLLPLLFGPRDGRRRAGLSLAAAAAVLVAAAVALGGWPRLLSPLAYQRDRGLQIEAVAATPALLARLHDPAYEVVWSRWNAFEVSGPLVAPLLRATTVASVLGLAALAALFVAWFRRGARPEAAAHLALTAVALFMITSRALSPQYLLWLAALAVVVPGLARPADAASQSDATLTLAWTAVLLALTTLVYPLFYDDLLSGARALPTWLLAARNAALVAFAARCAWLAVRPGPGSLPDAPRLGRDRADEED